MLENRLRKLRQDEIKLQKETATAKKHSKFADMVQQRRADDHANMNNHKSNLNKEEQKQRELNNFRRADT